MIPQSSKPSQEYKRKFTIMESHLSVQQFARYFATYTNRNTLLVLPCLVGREVAFRAQNLLYNFFLNIWLV